MKRSRKRKHKPIPYKDYHTGPWCNERLVALRKDWKTGRITEEKYFKELQYI